MDRIFSPNKWFVLFCGFLILVWAGWQYVADLRLTCQSRLQAEQIFTWSWADKNWTSKVKITGARVLYRSPTDAIVMIQGKQVLTMPVATDGDEKTTRSEVDDCAATLTFYRHDNNWELAKVEFE